METDMYQFKSFTLPSLPHRASRAMFAAALALPLFMGAVTTHAQAKPNPAQQQTLAQCLIGCNKHDASCQNSCTQTSSSAAYAKSAGSCVRACADSLVVPGQQQSQTGDLKTCIQACN
jgi:hypothetical protein